jgi:hypothetical protein
LTMMMRVKIIIGTLKLYKYRKKKGMIIVTN